MAQHQLTERYVTTMMPTALAPARSSLSNTPSSSEVDHHVPPEQDDERALLCQVALQDQQAFATLYARYASCVRRYLRRCLGQADLVDDVLQEVMLVLWQRPSTCPPTVPLIAWLCGIARHKARKTVRRAAAPPVRPPPPPDSAVEDPACGLLRQEDGHRLTRALDTLPFYERTALQLLVQQGCSYQEIAAVMDTPVSTVRTRLWRACHRLRAHVVAGDAAAPSSLPRISRECQALCSL
jgi:RNA polymerase sigma-70 factor (ECF subfamily)